MEKLFLAKFSGTDIVVWNGIITTLNVIHGFVQIGDQIKLANHEEERRYRIQQK